MKRKNTKKPAHTGKKNRQHRKQKDSEAAYTRFLEKNHDVYIEVAIDAYSRERFSYLDSLLRNGLKFCKHPQVVFFKAFRSTSKKEALHILKQGYQIREDSCTSRIKDYATDLAELGFYEEAIKNFRRVLGKEADDPDVWLRKGLRYFQEDEHELSALFLGHAQTLGIDTKFLRVELALSQAFTRGGRECEEVLMTLAEHPKLGEALLLLGNKHLAKCQFKRAVELFERAALKCEADKELVETAEILRLKALILQGERPSRTGSVLKEALSQALEFAEELENDELVLQILDFGADFFGRSGAALAGFLTDEAEPIEIEEVPRLGVPPIEEKISEIRQEINDKYFSDFLCSNLQPAYELSPVDSPEKAASLLSFYGGLPIADESFEWPLCSAGHSMQFLGQIDCRSLSSEFTPCLPEHGILYFFTACEEDEWIDGGKVVYVPVVPAKMMKIFPQDRVFYWKHRLTPKVWNEIIPYYSVPLGDWVRDKFAGIHEREGQYTDLYDYADSALLGYGADERHSFPPNSKDKLLLYITEEPSRDVYPKFVIGEESLKNKEFNNARAGTIKDDFV